MYQLYLGSSTAGFAPHILLREIGADFELAFLDVDAGEHREAPYLAINPFGRIPALVTDGRAMAESAAICLWLADRHPDAGLAPAPDAAERTDYLQWMLFLASTLHGALMPYFYPQRYITDGNERAVKDAAERRAGEWFMHVEQHLAKNGPYLLGDAFSAADIYLFMLVRWGRHFQSTPASLPALGAFAQRMLARATVRDAFAAEGITERFC